MFSLEKCLFRPFVRFEIESLVFLLKSSFQGLETRLTLSVICWSLGDEVSWEPWALTGWFPLETLPVLSSTVGCCCVRSCPGESWPRAVMVS